jgi:hypothetical protein
MPNRKADSLTWRTEIRTPGLPPNTRRLGDLRLECAVGVAAGLISGGKPSRRFPTLEEPCGVLRQYQFFSDRPLFGVTMIDGGRREILSIHDLYAEWFRPLSEKRLSTLDCQVLLDRVYTLAVDDQHWSDDTLVEFEYMDDVSDRQNTAPAIAVSVAGSGAERNIVIGQSTKKDLLAAFGPAYVIRFDNGYEVWGYQKNDGIVMSAKATVERMNQGMSWLGNTEIVALLAPDGIVAKIRIRPAPTKAD